jgi:hypothetical protein
LIRNLNADDATTQHRFETSVRRLNLETDAMRSGLGGDAGSDVPIEVPAR